MTERLLNITLDTLMVADMHMHEEDIVFYQHPRKRILEEDGYQETEWCTASYDFWNNAVKEDSTVVFHLGDLLNDKAHIDTLGDLNGSIINLKGNHDISNSGKLKKKADIDQIKGCHFIQNGLVFELNNVPKMAHCVIMDIDGVRIMFTHYMIFGLSEDGFDMQKFGPTITFLQQLFEQMNCDINIHGHIHTNRYDDPRCRCVSFGQYYPDMRRFPTLREVIAPEYNTMNKFFTGKM
ncbi:hypothetical protein PCE1_000250 [Barthelona sp. PCE]